MSYNEDEESDDEKKQEDERCRRCHHTIEQGADIIGLQEGVMGPRGFIALEAYRFFCDENCLLDYFHDGKVEKLPRRIP